MCQAIKFTINNHQILFSFLDKNPCLPLLMAGNRIMITPWGKQIYSQPVYPVGHTAHMDEVRASNWRQYLPKSARIGCESYMLIDKQSRECWYDLKPGQYIKGLVATAFGDDRAYILMRNPEILDPEGHTEWPVLNHP